MRFPAGEDTSTPNHTVTLAYDPDQMAVSQFNGNVAVIHAAEVNKVTVYDKNLNKLYDITPHKNISTEFPIAVTYDNSGNLYISEFDTYGGDGRVLEYYGDDTSADKTWILQYDGATLDVIAMTAGTYLWAVGYGEGSYSYMDTVFICTNGGSTSCVNTGIPNNSRGNVSFAFLPQQIAITIEGSGSGSELAEMYCSSPYLDYCTDNDSHIEYYTANTSGAWSHSGGNQVCDASSHLYQSYLASDGNGTLYWPCLKYGSGHLGESTVQEKQTDGTKYTISGLTNPVAAGAY
jgi:hypothetical protein